MRRIIILGHSGFIGKHLTKYLTENPKTSVIGASYPFYDLTKTEDGQKLSKLFHKDAVVAMLSAIKPNIADTISSCVQNIEMVVNLCKILEKHPVRRIVYMSSAAVYGEDIPHRAITEKTPVSPRTYYGIAKYTAETLLSKTTNHLVILRPPAIYGPGEKEISYNPSGFLKKALRNEEIVLWGDGKEKREFIYIDDIVYFLSQLLYNSFEGVVNIASGKSYSFAQALGIVKKLVHRDVKVARRQRTKEKVDHYFDNTLLKKLVPKFRFTTLVEGLSQTYEALHNL